MSLRYGCDAYICIAFVNASGGGFARADTDWENVLDEDEVWLEQHPECLPLSLEGYTIDPNTGAATDCDLGWVCGYATAAEALVRELGITEWWELAPTAYDRLCKRFKVGAYERSAC